MSAVSWNGNDWVAELTLPAWKAFTRGTREATVEVVFLDASAETPPDTLMLSALSSEPCGRSSTGSAS